MSTRSNTCDCNTLAAAVAPEDLARGDFVAVLREVVETPSFFWCEVERSDRAEIVRIERIPTDDRAPLKIKAICLPFVFVKQFDGKRRTLDMRLTRLARLDREYAKTVWKAMTPRH